MTSTPGSDPHPDVAEISDLAEDLLAPQRAEEVRLHVAQCPLCADVLASLTEISELLGALPLPEPMPTDVADRLDAALAVEARTTQGSDPDVPRRDVPRETSPSAPGRVPRGTSTTPAHHSAGDTGPGRADRTGRHRRRVAVLAAGWAVGALALGGILYGVASSAGGGGGSVATQDNGVASKRVDSMPAGGSVADQVRQLLAESYAPALPGGDATEPPDHRSTPLLKGTDTAPTPGPGAGQGSQGHGVADLPSCVLKATHRTQAPLAVGRDEYQGTPSYLVVLPHPGDSGQVDAFVVSASCTADTPGTVLFQGTYSR